MHLSDWFKFTVKLRQAGNAGRIQDFKLEGGGGAALRKIADGGPKIFGVLRVKNHDFTPINHIFSNFRGGGEGGAGCAPWIRP